MGKFFKALVVEPMTFWEKMQIFLYVIGALSLPFAVFMEVYGMFLKIPANGIWQSQGIWIFGGLMVGLAGGVAILEGRRLTP